jgi:hypothetical protein
VLTELACCDDDPVLSTLSPRDRDRFLARGGEAPVFFFFGGICFGRFTQTNESKRQIVPSENRENKTEDWCASRSLLACDDIESVVMNNDDDYSNDDIDDREEEYEEDEDEDEDEEEPLLKYQRMGASVATILKQASAFSIEDVWCACVFGFVLFLEDEEEGQFSVPTRGGSDPSRDLLSQLPS